LVELPAVLAAPFGGSAVDVNSVYGNRNGQGNEIADTTFARVAPVPSCSATWVWNARAVTSDRRAYNTQLIEISMKA